MKKFTSQSQKIGELGENVACKFLEKKGFYIKERNYTKKWGEIDIIATKEGKLYFIEVKSVSRDLVENDKKDEEETFRPEENMHPWKIRRLARTVGTYLIHNRIGNTEWQFDLAVVSLDMHKRLTRVRMIENIVLG